VGVNWAKMCTGHTGKRGKQRNIRKAEVTPKGNKRASEMQKKG
jgi:hypothetical protein